MNDIQSRINNSLSASIANRRKTSSRPTKNRFNNRPKNFRIRKSTESPKFFTGSQVFVSSLESHVGESDLRDIFRGAGMIKRIKLHFDKKGKSIGTAEIAFSRRADAVSACRKYNKVFNQIQKIEKIAEQCFSLEFSFETLLNGSFEHYFPNCKTTDQNRKSDCDVIATFKKKPFFRIFLPEFALGIISKKSKVFEKPPRRKIRTDFESFKPEKIDCFVEIKNGVFCRISLGFSGWIRLISAFDFFNIFYNYYIFLKHYIFYNFYLVLFLTLHLIISNLIVYNFYLFIYSLCFSSVRIFGLPIGSFPIGFDWVIIDILANETTKLFFVSSRASKTPTEVSTSFFLKARIDGRPMKIEMLSNVEGLADNRRKPFPKSKTNVGNRGRRRFGGRRRGFGSKGKRPFFNEKSEHPLLRTLENSGNVSQTSKLSLFGGFGTPGINENQKEKVAASLDAELDMYNKM